MIRHFQTRQNCKTIEQLQPALLTEVCNIPDKRSSCAQVYMAPTSFNAPVGGSMDPGADTVGETIADDNEASPEEVAVRLNLHQDMDNVLATLSERESGILRCRYGLDDGRQRTLEEVGQIFKASPAPLPRPPFCLLSRVSRAAGSHMYIRGG